MQIKIHHKRIYEDPSQNDGLRILVDRLWPRGISKENAQIDHWQKELAPSGELRKWFNHEPKKWVSFKRKYIKELRQHKDLVDDFITLIKGEHEITLLYAAKDVKHNQAVVLHEFLQEVLNKKH